MANFYYSTTASVGPTYSMSNGVVGSSGTIFTTSGSNGTSWASGSSYLNGSAVMQVNGSMSVDGNLTIKGKDVFKLMEQIENRLAILQEPDPKKLEKFAALKKAYDHYKLMEKLIGEE